jgi:hypothetical protein
MTVGAVSANCLSRPHPGPIIRSPAGLRQDGTALVFLNAQKYGVFADDWASARATGAVLGAPPNRKSRVCDASSR